MFSLKRYSSLLLAFGILAFSNANANDSTFPIDLKYNKCMENSGGVTMNLVECGQAFADHWDNELKKYQDLSKKACAKSNKAEACSAQLEKAISSFNVLRDNISDLYYYSDGSISKVIAIDNYAWMTRAQVLRLQQFVSIMGVE